MKTKFFLAIALIAILLSTAVAQEMPTPGILEVITAGDDDKELVLPLMHTKVKADISGYIARVEVQQKFHNPYKEKIEARYVFPLPENAAVNEMFMKIGDKIIYSEIHERQKAKKTYEEAKKKGHRAALLEQERPNMFTQTVGNIMPGDEIIITIRYSQDLKYKNGEYTYFFPTVVGPRYIPGNSIGRQAGGFSPDTDAVPDASGITPQVIPPGFRSGHDIEITVNINAGTEVTSVDSISHHILTKKGKVTTVELKPFDTIPNKDFILCYKVTGEDPTTGILTHKQDKGGFFTLMINPPDKVKPEKVTPKEMIFVVDCSGSMSGEPISKCKAAMRHAIANLNPDDNFQIIKFSDSANGFSRKLVPNTTKNVKKAMRFINEMRGTGGTQMIEGIKAALDYPELNNKIRIVLFMTDGYIGNENQIIKAIKKKLGKARLFSFGVGSSVNRFLLESMAEAGRGRCEYIPLNEDTKKVVSEFYGRIRNPLWTDIRIDWDGMEVSELYPAQIPDLFSKTPVLVVGKYKSSGKKNITITGNVNGKQYSQTLNVNFPAKSKANKVLSILWARKKIHELESGRNFNYYSISEEVKQQIINLALKFKLLTRFTSMVAVERDIITDSKLASRTVDIPVELPEGVNFNGVFGKAHLTLKRIKPGDPTLIVDAPTNAVSIVALFPFGMNKELHKDAETELWSCRFLVPRNVSDGIYYIKVLIMCSDGERYELYVPYTIDSKAPIVDIQSTVQNINGKLVLRLGAFPKTILNEAMTASSIYSAIISDIRDIKIMDWNNNIHSLEMVDEGDELFWYAEIPLDEEAKGRKRIVVQVMDYAGNFTTQEMDVEVQ